MAITTRSGKGSPLTNTEMDTNLKQIPNGSDSSITDDGSKVGIGTSSPSELLDVDGRITLSDDGVLKWGASAAHGRLSWDTGKTIIQAEGSNALILRTGGSERMRITSTGNLGLGTTVPRGKLDIVGDTDLDSDFLTIQDNDPTEGSQRPSIRFRSSTAQIGQILSLSGSMRFSSGITEDSMLEILDNGNVGICDTNPDAKLSIISAGDEALALDRTGNDGTVVRIRNDGTTCGTITISGSSTAFNTSSDYRLKENVVPMTDSIDRLKELKPSRFNFIINADTTVDGFLAHEAGEVVPEAVTGAKDAMMTEEYEVTPALGEIFTPAIEEVTTEQPVMETVEGDTYVNLAGETITETSEVAVTNEVITTVIERQDIDGVMTEVEVERTIQEPVMETVVTIEAVAEVIIESDVEQSESLEDGQQWRQTIEAEMGEREVEDMQGIDQSKLVPLLVSAVQELTAKVEALESQLSIKE